MRHFWLIGACLTLAACGDPFGGMGRLSDSGLGGGPSATVIATGDAPLLSEAAAGPLEREVLAGLDAQEPRPPRGLLAMLGLDGGGADEDGGAPVSPAAAASEGTGGGFLSGPRRTGPDAADVAPGTVLPFGEIARVCDVAPARRGTLVADVSGYQIFDTIPNSNAARPFYISGFRDRCARTFTGVLAIPGDVGTHEVIRYQPSNNRIAYSATDEEYERIKARICSAPRGQPCGRRLDALARTTHFVTVYDRFGGSERWVEILLHSGEVAAIGFKG
ncbi:hypothetical protein [Histidinibacterium lentulum]|uniref:Uncharacterized protein n=1 Tax=Histidinibacterium lentulum TaxID=2480588 RepID=A0A3N2R520_9RHOB|nr:hypothetical protein [Histidinibacterium lentulum]ROU02461.1 hypothetical protein EAT49_08965 [Histidinibacterium lentulum]